MIGAAWWRMGSLTASSDAAGSRSAFARFAAALQRIARGRLQRTTLPKPGQSGLSRDRRARRGNALLGGWCVAFAHGVISAGVDTHHLGTIKEHSRVKAANWQIMRYENVNRELLTAR